MKRKNVQLEIPDIVYLRRVIVMSKKRAQSASSMKNLHEVAKLSPEEIDCLLNPSEDIAETTSRDDFTGTIKILTDSSFAFQFASALSFYLSTQFETKFDVKVTGTRHGNFSEALRGELGDFGTLLFENRQRRVVSALMISRGFFESSTANTLSPIANSNGREALSAENVVFRDLASVSGLMGKGLELVPGSLEHDSSDLDLSDHDIQIIELQIQNASGTYSGVAQISPFV